MQYNVENLMDPYHDPGKQDEDFTPDGKEHWTLEALDWKMRNLARVISSIKNPNGSSCPDVLVLEEIENPAVAKRFKDGFLNDCNYKKIVIDAQSQDIRGIRVAMMTRLDLAETPRSHFVFRGGRTVQETTLQIGDHKLTVFANHWKSRLTRPPDTDGGEAKRALYAKTVRARLEKLFENDPDADVIVAGDFNDEPENKSLSEILGVAGKASPIDSFEPLLWEPSYELRKLVQNFELSDLSDSEREEAFHRLRGTYYYRKQFFQLDHLLISKGLFDDQGFSYQRGSYEVVRYTPFVEPRTKSPLPFKIQWDESGNDRGPKGASDHFPILIRLNYQNSTAQP
jgi:PAS domain-containing protein